MFGGRKMTNKSCLCPKCEGKVFGLLNELKSEAMKQKRAGIVSDTIEDVEFSIQDGNISEVKKLAKTILEKNELDRQTILEQALLSLSKEDLNKVEKGIIKKKANLKKGCLNINIDGLEVPIFSRASFLD